MRIKAIQSFVPFNHVTHPGTTISKNYTYVALLSALQLKKLYGEVTLYTNETMAEFFTAMDFPYIYDTCLEGEHGAYFAMPKLRAFMLQKDPFVHFDLDSLVFQKPNIEDKKSPFIFSHPDMPNRGYTKEERKYKSRYKHKVIAEILQDPWFDNLAVSYFKQYWLAQGLPEDYPIHLFNPNNIPNMNIIGVKDVKTFQKATKRAMEIADKNVQLFNREWLASNFIEQMTIPLYCELYSKQYKKALDDHLVKDPIGSPFTFSGDPFTCGGMKGFDQAGLDGFKTSTVPFPFHFEHYYQCGECLDWHEKKHQIKSEDILKKHMDLSKFRFVHIGGGNKEYVLWQAMVIHTLVENYGEEVVLKVAEYFKILEEESNIKGKISPGEQYYEHLTNNKLFSKKSLV